MTHHLGAGYAESWARDQHLAGLDGRTVAVALDDGVPVRSVWRAVCEALDIPPQQR
jgi:hypothetical protein